MVTAITENIDLTAIECYDGTTHYKKCTVEYVNDHRKEQLSDINGNIISGGNIKKIRNANSLEFYENLIYPHLPYFEKELYDEIKRNIPEWKENSVSFEAINSAMERKKKDKAYYEDMERTYQEKQKITEALEWLSKEEYAELYAEWEKMLNHEFGREIAIKANMRKILKDRFDG